MALPVYLAHQAFVNHFDKIIYGFVAISAAQVPLTFYQTKSLRSFEAIEKINLIFEAATVLLALGCWGKLKLPLVASPLMALPIGATYWGCRLVNHYFKNREISKAILNSGFNDEKVINAKWASFSRIEPLNVAILCQMISFLALSIVSSYQPFCLLGVAFSIASYVLAAPVGAVEYKWTTSFSEGNRWLFYLDTKYSFNFFRGLGRTDDDDHCTAYCGMMEESYPLCEKHAYHFHSIVLGIFSKLKFIYNEYTAKVDNSGKLVLTLKSSKIPNCPVCRGLPKNGYGISVLRGSTPIEVNIDYNS